MEATKFRRDIWQNRDILVFITKWVVLINGFPDERLLDVLKCVSKFLSDFIDGNLRVLLRKSYDYLESIQASHFYICGLKFERMDDGALGVDFHEYISYAIESHDYGNEANMRKQHGRLHLSLAQGFWAILLEFKAEAEKKFNFFPLDLEKYTLREITNEQSGREMYHGEIIFIINNRGLKHAALLFQKEKTGESETDLALAMTAIGMSLHLNPYEWDNSSNYQQNLNLLKTHFADRL